MREFPTTELNIPRIEATSYCYRFKTFEHWEIDNKTQSKRYRLSGEITEVEIGSIVAKACRDIKNIAHVSVDKLFDLIIDKGFAETVSVRFLGKNNLEAVNGCCSDFDVWQDLFLVKKEFVWLGHSPTTSVEYDEKEDTVRVWIDEKYLAKNRKEYSIIFNWREFKENLKTLQNDLEEFTVLLESWAETTSPTKAKDLVERFKMYLGIRDLRRF